MSAIIICVDWSHYNREKEKEREREKENEKGQQKEKGEICARLVEKKRIVVVIRRTCCERLQTMSCSIFFFFVLFSWRLIRERDSCRSCTWISLQSNVRVDYNFARILRGTVCVCVWVCTHERERENGNEKKQVEWGRRCRRSRDFYIVKLGENRARSDMEREMENTSEICRTPIFT